MIHFLDEDQATAIAITGSYDTTLVLISCLIAVFASFAGLLVCDRAGTAVRPAHRFAWLALGSVVMGFSVWSMHFIGMLAFVLPVAVTYDASITFISVLPAILASAFALYNITRNHTNLWMYVASGTVLGLGIGAMHFSGMAAMTSDAEMHYDPVLFGLSLAIAVVLGNAAIYAHVVGNRLFGHSHLILSSLAAATIMGLAISGMHYTAMAATSYSIPTDSLLMTEPPTPGHPTWLATGVFVVAALITLTALIGIFMGRRFQANTELLDETRQQLIETSDAIEAINDGFVVFDHEDRLLLCNSAYTALTGYSAEESLGQVPALLRQIRADQALNTRLHNSLAQHGSWQGEIWAQHKNGEQVPLWFKVSKVQPREERPRHRRQDHNHADLHHFVATLADMRERKAAEEEMRTAQEALAQSEAQFRQIANGMPQMAWITQANGQHEWFNARWYEYTGRPRGAKIDLDWIQYLHPDDRDRTQSKWRQVLASGEVFNTEYRCRRHDGEWRWFLASALPLRNADGSIVRWFGTCTDIHDHKKVEEELRQANQELEEFAYVAAHDLQEPLRKVSMYTQLLLSERDSATPKTLQEFRGFIQSGVARMQTLIQDLLQYSRTIHHSVEQDSQAADLNQALAEAMAILDHSQDSQLQHYIQADPLPRVRADQSQMTLLFQNLLSNALKYRREDVPPQIRIEAHKDGGDWVVSVRDNGIGFAPEYQSRIFGLFKRLYKDEYPGTGLGLAICKRIVERYQGHIWASSEGEGQGATFQFRLPAALEPKQHST